MKKINLVISAIALASIVSVAGAIKLCQLDWFAAWRGKASGALANSGYAFTRSTYDNTTTGHGTWSVTSDEGSTGARHTVSGIAQCGTSTATLTGLTSYPDVSSIASDNKNCLCKMTTPNHGASWVFLLAGGSAAYCARYCANNCAHCVRSGVYDSCSRSAVLALPQ